jgi:hypothetical protein
LTVDQPVAIPLPTQDNTNADIRASNGIRIHDPGDQAKTFHALDRVAPVIGAFYTLVSLNTMTASSC